MASANDFPVGYKFHPRDEELVGYYLRNKVHGAPFKDENVIPDIDLYGGIEARDIWNNNGGQNLGKGEDLYFFTKLKPTSSKSTGSLVARTIGSGTWHGQNSGTKIKDPKTKDTIVCRIRKNYDRKRKADDREETKVVESQRKNIQKQFENIDESYVSPVSSEVAEDVNTNHYPQLQKPQQEQQTNLQHNGFVNNVDHCYNQQQQKHCNVIFFPQCYYDSQEPMARLLV
ncbi:hypothetical protein ACFX13_028920 [Malus domestica]